MKSHRPPLYILFAGLLATVSAHADTVIIKDTFTPIDGKAARLDAHHPDLSLTGAGWQFTSASDKPNTEPYVHQDRAVRTRFNGAGYIFIGNQGSYKKPDIITLQADLTLNTLDGPAAAGAGIALGFYKAVPLPRGNEVTINFLGLIIDQAGKLSLLDVSGANLKRIHAGVSLPNFTPDTPVTLRYSIDIRTGTIIDVTCDGIDYTASFKHVAGLFTPAATDYAAFFGRANSRPSASGTVDNFSISTPN